MNLITYYNLKNLYEAISEELGKILSYLTLNEFCRGYNKFVSDKEYSNTFFVIVDSNSTDSIMKNIESIFETLVNSNSFYCEYHIKFLTDREFMHNSFGKIIPIKIYFKVTKENPQIIKKND